jgi:phosphatidylglycerophosphate synthase
MIDNHFRNLLPALVAPLIAIYRRLGATPNQISIAGAGVAALAAVSVALGWTWLALILWWLSRLLDGTDGIYARETGQTSRFGAYLDITLDMFAYSAMIVGFYFYLPSLAFVWIVILLLYVLCITTALAMGDLEERLQLSSRDNRGIRLGAGIAEGGETGIAYTLLLILPGWTLLLALTWIAVLITTVVCRSLLVYRVSRDG